MALADRRSFDAVAVRQLMDLELGWLTRQARTWAALRVEAHLGTGLSPPPVLAGLAVTESCNLRCPMCDLPARYAQQPHAQPTAVWMRAIDQLHDLGATAIGFIGGEPTMRRDIFDLMAHARSNGTPVNITTNALLLNDSRIEQLIDADPSSVNVSIDSGRAEVNDRLRGGRNILPRTLERLRRVAELRDSRGGRCRLTVVTVLSNENIDDLDLLFEAVRDAGADAIGFMPMHELYAGRWRVIDFGAREGDVTHQLRELSKRHHLPLDNSKRFLDDLARVIGGRWEMPGRCNAGYTSLLIGPDLSLYRCFPYFEKQSAWRRWSPAGPSLRDLWNDDVARRERLSALGCRECFWNCHAEVNTMLPM